MAIQNASDLLVYKRTTPAQKQITRVFVKTSNPLIFADGLTSGTIKISNITDGSGTVKDDQSTAAATANTATNVLAKIGSTLASSNDYSASSTTVEGAYTYRDFTNGADGVVPLLSFSNGTATIKNNAIKVSIVQSGQNLAYEPVAHSTSASISMNTDLRDTTTKDSQGYSESAGGLKSVEISTDALIDLTENVDPQSFINDIKNQSSIRLKYSDRITNLINTNVTQSTIDGFSIANATQTQNQPDPFGGDTGAKITYASGSFARLQYSTTVAKLEGKNFVWSFYVKGIDASKDSISIGINKFDSDGVSNSVSYNDYTTELVSGIGTISNIQPSGKVDKVDNVGFGGTDTENWTRIKVSSNNPFNAEGKGKIEFRMYVGTYNTSVSGQAIFTSSWQLEIGNVVTPYQSPADISCYSGLFLPSSISLDAGVEENATFSSSFTSSGELYKDGLGPELIEDTTFDNPSYWILEPTNGSLSVVESGYGKIITTSGTLSFIKSSVLAIMPNQSTDGNYYNLTYTVAQSSNTNFVIADGGFTGEDLSVPASVGTHTIIMRPGTNSLVLKRSGSTCTIWLSSISLKKLAPID